MWIHDATVTAVIATTGQKQWVVVATGYGNGCTDDYTVYFYLLYIISSCHLHQY